MEDAEGALSFDFEGGLDAGAPAHASSAPASLMPSDPTAAAANAGAVATPVAGDAASTGGNIPGRRSFRQTVCRHWLRSLCMKGDACGFLHQYDKARMPVCRFFRIYGECREQDCVYKHTNEDIKECNMYFIVKSCNRENLEISVQQGVWATQRSNEAKLNEAFESSENVILIFSINRTRHFQGCAKMTSKIGGYVGGGNWKYAHGTAHYGRNFSVKWLKLCELSFNKTHHLRNPYNDNLPVKISRDCQELEPFIGEQLASLLYLEPDSELMAMLIAAESKCEEEKAKGVSTDEAADNPDIVLFEDNEEEEDEESEEEDESSGQSAQGRGRGRGMMWQPHMPPVRGGRPMLGVRGFPPVMMGADGFGYGDGFATPDFFGVPPRVFGPYGGPRFSGDFSGTGSMSGLVFPGRPPQPSAIFPMGGLGMMMGPGRAPFMGGMVMRGVGRATRPMGVPPFLHPPPPLPNTRAAKRDQRRPASDWSDMHEPGLDQGSKGQEMTGPSHGVDDEMVSHHGAKAQTEGKFVSANSFQNDSESEDEAAPRRSRHGEGKRKRPGSEGEAALDQ
ncbi:zinc finger CCCH domain-containing protein 45-like isoform X2 [Phoenix dactylifera]|uniref:Zinc finger CCCH domain-containing protein 45-like isoform X2 n=1 Tax=Phoenix dactylifera TaxID=42345 RepID=A0A8B9AXM3_PHODC|nr:zinc finger CCCH domain-containing protein 45-like isoform X2 [Phoenix dactylifera]